MFIYEINPPKIPAGASESSSEIKLSVEKLVNRVSEIESSCNGIHITDSVLGTKRVSPLTVGKILKTKFPHMQITVSLRVRDRDMDSLRHIVADTISVGIDGILVLKGDPGQNGYDSGLFPSGVVDTLKAEFKANFFLSLPSNPNFEKIQKKILASPVGFMTQVIHSVEQAKRIADNLRPQGFRIVPCVLLPSEKNSSSANFLGLDWSEYKEDPAEFIRKVHHVAGDVLITSPNDFAFARDVMATV